MQILWKGIVFSEFRLNHPKIGRIRIIYIISLYFIGFYRQCLCLDHPAGEKEYEILASLVAGTFEKAKRED